MRTQEQDAARQRERRAKDPSYFSNYDFLRKYGITLAQRDAMFDAQGRACLVCRTTDFGKRGPQVDHDHETGAVRGIVCIGCNLGLGAFNDDPIILANAVIYLDPTAPRVDEHY